MKWVPLFLLAWVIASQSARCGTVAQSPPSVSPAAALVRLRQGNRRFMGNHPQPKHERARQHALASAQHPYAVVFACSDSRVSPEVIFDSGLGELFVVRVAGNVTDRDGIASAEYAVEHLGVRLVLVMGHSGCGAVTAVVTGQPATGLLAELLKEIEPACAGLPSLTEIDREALVERAVHANIAWQIQHLWENSSLLREAVRLGEIKLAGACYDLRTGRVAMEPESLEPGSTPTRQSHSGKVTPFSLRQSIGGRE